MAGLVVFVVVIVGVVALMWFGWRHRAGALARGIGAAGAGYNSYVGFRGPPAASDRASDDGLTRADDR